MNINAPHLLTTALLLLIAFLAGAVLGLVLRRLVDRLTRRKPAVAAVQPAVPAQAPVAPEPAPAEPAMPEPVPELLDPVVAIDRHVKAPMRPVFAIPDLPPLVPVEPVQRPDLAPARRAGETAAGRPLWSPYQPVEPPKPVRSNGVSATIIPFPRAEDERPTAALVEELEQLMSTPVPVPVAPAEPLAPVVNVEPVLVVEAPHETAPTPEPAAEAIAGTAEIAPAQPEPPAVDLPAAPEPLQTEAPTPVPMTGPPLGLEAQIASALGAELLPPGAAPIAPVEEQQASQPPEPQPLEPAEADDIAAETAEEHETEPLAEFVPDVVPDVLPEPEPVAPLADEAEVLAEPVLAADEIVADDDPSLDLDARIEPDIVEPLPEAELAAARNSVPLPVPEPVVDPAEAPLPELADWDEFDAEADEAAAMRAIEGNWSPRRAASPAAKPVERPEGVASPEPPPSAADALAASAAAVASARRIARAVVDDVSPHSARPPALPGPRDGHADDLTQIIGVLPVVESALNRLGVYHYDQIAAWGADTVNWVETYLGLEGRIGREHWRLQAHELAEAKPPRPSSGGQEIARVGE